MRKKAEIPKHIEELLDRIEREASPVSIFLYGSRARGDFRKDSDYEIGVLFKQEKKWGREQLAGLHSFQNVHLYPFGYEDFINYKLDVPFPKAIFLRELIMSAITLRGEKVIDSITPAEITYIDLLETISFHLGRALDAVLVARKGDMVTAADLFSKSALYGAQALIILQKKKFPIGYTEIEKEFRHALISHAIHVREGGKIKSEWLYENISFLNGVRAEIWKNCRDAGI